MLKLSVILMIKDGEEYMRYISKYFSKTEELYKDLIEFEYFIYENNSKDNTRKEIENFFETRKGLYWCEDIDKNKDFGSIVKNDRGSYMGFLRNRFKENHGELDSDYTMIFDSDVIFPENYILDLLKSFQKGKIRINPSFINNVKIDNIDNKIIKEIYNKDLYKYFFLVKDDKIITKRIDKNEGWDQYIYIDVLLKDIVMVNGFSKCYESYKEKKWYNHYYDSLALITKDDINYKHNNNTCMFINCDRCYKFRKSKYNKYLISDGNTTRVNSAFGGCSIIKTNIYNKIKWGQNDVCEHFEFCKMARQYGNIIINPTVVSYTTTDKYRNYDEISNLLIN